MQTFEKFEGGLTLEIERLKTVKVPTQETITDVIVPGCDPIDVPAFFLGLGPSPPANLAMRKRIGHPGAPFGGMGFFDPQKNREAAGDDAPPEHITAEVVRLAKIREFDRCSQGLDSIYFWALQPIFNTEDICVSSEILVRSKNGSDSAPFEDVQAVMDPGASEDIRKVYAAWKAYEVVDWTLKTVKDNPILTNLHGIASNLRPLDMPSTSFVRQEIWKRIEALEPEDQKLIKSTLVIEVTEDQEVPEEELIKALTEWKAASFRLSYDDTIGDLACAALSKKGDNFHTIAALYPYVDHFAWLKVDIEWAGYMLFLSHPAYNSRAQIKAEVLAKAQEEDTVYVPAGPSIKSTDAKFSDMLKEFAEWVLEMLGKGHVICIELSVNQSDVNNLYALGKLKELGLDIFGGHQAAAFRFQGGQTGARAFTPHCFAQGATAFNVAKD